jgi:hypothetical protein
VVHAPVAFAARKYVTILLAVGNLSSWHCPCKIIHLQSVSLITRNLDDVPSPENDSLPWILLPSLTRLSFKCANVILFISFVMEQTNQTSTSMLKSYFNRKCDGSEVMVCRFCKKNIKAAKGLFEIGPTVVVES